jgi:flagellar motility protein MotE (MotC chaperone)
MIKKICFTVASLLILGSTQAQAQSSHYDPHLGRYIDSSATDRGKTPQQLRDELERERYLTEIAMERSRRRQLEQEQDAQDYNSRMREVEYRRSQEEREYRERTNEIYSVNQGVNVIANAIYAAQSASQNW